MLKYRITNTYYIVKITNYITNTFNINNIINIAFSTCICQLMRLDLSCAFVLASISN